MTQYRSWPGTAAASPRCGRKVSHEGGWFPHCPSPNSRMLQNLRGVGQLPTGGRQEKMGTRSRVFHSPPTPTIPTRRTVISPLSGGGQTAVQDHHKATCQAASDASSQKAMGIQTWPELQPCPPDVSAPFTQLGYRTGHLWTMESYLPTETLRLRH